MSPGLHLYAIDDSATRAAIYVDHRLSASAPTASEHGVVTISLQAVTVVNVYLHPNFEIAINS